MRTLRLLEPGAEVEETIRRLKELKSDWIEEADNRGNAEISTGKGRRVSI